MGLPLYPQKFSLCRIDTIFELCYNLCLLLILHFIDARFVVLWGLFLMIWNEENFQIDEQSESEFGRNHAKKSNVLKATVKDHF